MGVAVYSGAAHVPVDLVTVGSGEELGFGLCEAVFEVEACAVGGNRRRLPSSAKEMSAPKHIYREVGS